jgi:hypothetical protein
MDAGRARPTFRQDVNYSGLSKAGTNGSVCGMKIEQLRGILAPVCRDFNVQRLDVFGSVSRETAAEASDIDLLVEFHEPAEHPARRFFGLLHSIEDLLGCEVDLLTTGSLRNPYFKKRVLAERIPLYEG